MGTSIPVAKWPSHKLRGAALSESLANRQLTGAKPTYQELSAGEEALPAGETAPFRALIHRKNKNQFSKIAIGCRLCGSSSCINCHGFVSC